MGMGLYRENKKEKNTLEISSITGSISGYNPFHIIKEESSGRIIPE